MEQPIEMKYYLENPTTDVAINECKRVADIFCRMGALTVRDPRVTFEDNSIFIDMVETYFNQPTEQKLKDTRPDFAYQVGATPEGAENPRCLFDPACKEIIDKMEPENKAHCPTGPDAKWRYFHSIGPRPAVTQFPVLNTENIIPEGFPQWNEVMNKWGEKLANCGHTLSQMAAIGLGLPPDAFTKLMPYAPHVLAPTASDLDKHGKLDTILAGFHQDLNFITLHGKSRYPGLYIWLRDGKKLPVSIPDGCILAQAGMQFEYLTGGTILAGYHEVVVSEQTLAAIQRAKDNNKCLWRISSTLFLHIASDNVLQPLMFPPNGESKDDHSHTLNKFPPILAGIQVERELKAIKLDKSQ